MTEAKTGERTAVLLEDDDIETLLAIARNEQSGRITPYEVRELVRVYRAFPALVAHFKWALAELDSLKAYMTRPERGGYGVECAVCRNEWFNAGDREALEEARSALEAAMKTEG